MKSILTKLLTTTDGLILGLLFMSLIIVPNFEIKSGLFVGVEEILVLVAGIRLLQLRKIVFSTYLSGMLLFIGWMLMSILFNQNRNQFNEYFEIYKALKFLTVFLYAYHFLDIQKQEVKSFINLTFGLLILFNLLHYFNIFNFNQHVVPWYDVDGRDIKQFGLNSLGQPAGKRMIGTMGNPNVNSILFLFYFAYYFMKVKINERFELITNIFLYLSLVCVVLCQSRTGIVALGVIYVLSIFLLKMPLKRLLFDLSIFVLFYFVITYQNEQSVQYLSNTVLNYSSNSSVRGRLEVWKYLIEMIKEKPFLGWGPNKGYMYEHAIYPENEYIFYTWKYGLVGLFFYLFQVFFPIFESIRTRKLNLFFLYVGIIIAIVALTNVPLSNVKINLIFAMIVGVVLKQLDGVKSKI